MKVATAARYGSTTEKGWLPLHAGSLASDNGVRSVRVLTPSRPTYDELWCYQEWARDQHVRLSVDGNGVVTVRPERDAQE